MSDHPRGVSPATNLIIMAFLMDLYVAMVSLATQYLGIHALAAPPVVLGLFATLSSLAYTIGCLFSGSISDRYGRRRCALVGCVGAAAAWAVMPLLPHWRFVLLVVPLPGLALSLFWPSVQAWIAEVTDGGRKQLGTSIGLFNVMWCAGLMIGPVVTGYMWDSAWTLTFYLPAAAMLIVIAYVLRTSRASGRGSADPDQAEDHEDTNLFLKLAWIGNFASFFATRTVSAMFPSLGDEIGLSTSEIGWLLFSVGAGQICVFLYTSYEHRWQYKLWPMMTAQFCASLGMIVVVFAGSKALFAGGFALVGISAGVTYVSSLFYALHGRSHGRGKTSGFHEAVLGGGVFMGPLLGGLAAEYLDFRAPFAIAATVLALACAAQIWLFGASRDRQAHRCAVAGGDPFGEG